MQVNILEAKNSLSQLIKTAQTGEDVIIANRGQPVAKLVRISASNSGAASSQASIRRAAPQGLAAWLHAHPLPVHVKRTPAQIQAALHAERSAWD
jgi:prevent-host-death family protein